MNRQQVLVAFAGVALLYGLYVFGKTLPPSKRPGLATAGDPGGQPGANPGDASNSGAKSGLNSKSIDFEDILQAAHSRLPPSQLSYVTRLEHSVVRGDVKEQQWKAYRQLAVFWADSVDAGFLPYAWYTGEAAKLENSEKSLTFAAQLFLRNLRVQDDPGLKGWMGEQAKGLFEKALALDPKDDSSRVGLGASMIFGNATGDPQETMQGVQQILEVSRRDSTNMYAQFMLALGGVESGQFDKAIDRLKTVVRHEPANIEAILLLAQVYQQTGDKADAIAGYKAAKKMTRDPKMASELDQLIQSLH